MAMKERMGRNTATSLTVQVKMWPTPRASMNENRTTQNAPSHGNGHGTTLAGVSSHHHQTTTTDGPNGSPRADLNPAFVEALMGLPANWSDPMASVNDFTSWATAWSRWLLAKRSSNSANDSE